MVEEYSIHKYHILYITYINNNVTTEDVIIQDSLQNVSYIKHSDNNIWYCSVSLLLALSDILQL